MCHLEQSDLMVNNQQDDVVFVDTLKFEAFGGWMNEDVSSETRFGKEAQLGEFGMIVQKEYRCFFWIKVNDTEPLFLVFILNPKANPPYRLLAKSNISTLAPFAKNLKEVRAQR